MTEQENILPTPQERSDNDLIELVVQLHARVIMSNNEAQHLAYNNARSELEKRLSDRDKFAMEFAKWVSDRYMYNNVSDTWLSLQGNTYTTSEKIFDLYKKSLTKTDKK